ncbi:hypothetical protein [Vitiosangium sp. GDMCC 1.1324]|uniref:hypothetical protein n=1 Tax=Vitiosangium sp. (strain GDMCC 1.1324) TaxID=2138576 RepID=UPI000D351FB9|nr:hypothetical protein [Vitiosangium sp. GDMCC 1.1324]PTL80595.1 hypothetical protein DAT35_28625 [Vitiosangium sp. GDMCC 1.1324]
MRRMAVGCLLLLATLSGCSSRFVDFTPDEEAIYDQPIDEVWPQVRAYFSVNGFAFRETPGGAQLETEWREEFAGSKVAAYWHRYLVIAKPEGPHRCKVVITRDTRSVNKALQAPGSDLLWTVDGRTADNPTGLGSDMAAQLEMQKADDNAVLVGQSRHTARDMAMEWKIFRKISPVLAQNAKKSADSPDVVVTKDASIECGVPILGLGKLARAGNVVLLGELHGTQQVPHFVAQSVCQVATQGIPVTVGLEVPDMNQARLEAFLASPGKQEDWAKLMESPFWRSPYPDGRNSEGVVFLIDALRKLRSQGLDVQVFAFDRPPLDGDAREEAMAKTVRDVALKSQKRALLVVSGNLHPRQVKGLPWNPDYRPMGQRLASELPQVYSLDIAYNSGSAWICAVDKDQKLDCGVKPAKGQDNGDRYFVQLFDGRNGQGYNGFYYVGVVSASLPAVYNGVEPAGDAQASVPAPTK